MKVLRIFSVFAVILFLISCTPEESEPIGIRNESPVISIESSPTVTLQTVPSMLPTSQPKPTVTDFVPPLNRVTQTLISSQIHQLIPEFKDIDSVKVVDVSNISLSRDGRFIVFVGTVKYKSDSDTHTRRDIYVYDRIDGNIEIITAKSDAHNNGITSFSPVISGNGRFVAFISRINNLVENDNNRFGDVFIYDRHEQIMELVAPVADQNTEQLTFVSVSYVGNKLSISNDGSVLAFVSGSKKLKSSMPTEFSGNIRNLIYIYHRESKEISLGSIYPDGTQGLRSQSDPSISANGRYLAFRASSAFGVKGTSAGVFLHDLKTNKNIQVIKINSGSDNSPNVYASTISPNGRYIAFLSDADNLVEQENKGQLSVFLHDRETSKTELISMIDSQMGIGALRSVGNPSVRFSADGRYVAFVSPYIDLVDADVSSYSDKESLSSSEYSIYTYDINNNTIFPLKFNIDNNQDNFELGKIGYIVREPPVEDTSSPHRLYFFDFDISQNGEIIAFVSALPNLTNDRTITDIFFSER